MKRRVNNTFLLLSVLLLASCDAPPEASKAADKSVAIEEPAEPPGDRALLIGINRYQSQDIRPLHGTGNDVRAFRAMLTSQLGFKDGEVKELKDSEATKAGILAAIDQWLVQGSRPGGRVVLYYSGHGTQADDLSGDEDDHKDEVLVAYDAQIDGRNWVLDDEIGERLERLQDRKVLAVFDSCHSGTVTRGAFDDVDAKTPGWDTETVAARDTLDLTHQKEGGFIHGGGNVSAFFAVAPNQKALEDKRDPVHPHGVFTSAFVVGIGGAADTDRDQHVSYAELFEFVQTQSRQYCTANPNKCSVGLTPTKELDDSRLAADIRQFGRTDTTANAPPGIIESASSLLPHGNDANLGIRIERAGAGQDANVRLGETVRYKVHSERAGKLLLFDIGVDGKVTQLFPNDYLPKTASRACQNNAGIEWVAAGTDVLIPDDCMGFAVEAQEPVGKGRLYAVLVEDAALDTTDLTSPKRGLGRVDKAKTQSKSTFVEVKNPQEWLERLRARLDKPYPEADGKNRQVQWSMTSIDYAITR